MMDGYKTTAQTRRSLAGFRATLPPEDSRLRICPPGCREKHDAGKVAGRDHWQPEPAPKRK